MRSILIIMVTQSIVFCEKYDMQEIMEIGKRGDTYRVWLYFTDKKGSMPIVLDQRTIDRRAKNGIHTNDLWYDLTISKNYINQISSLGITIKNESRWLNAISVICTLSDLERIAAFSFIKQIKPVVGHQKRSNIEYPDISPYSRDFDYGNALEQIEQINVNELHEQGYTGSGVRILVMDTGFKLTHNALREINVIDQWAADNENNDAIEIKRIFHEGTPAIARYFDPYAGTGTGYQNMLDGFGFGGDSPAAVNSASVFVTDINSVPTALSQTDASVSNFSSEIIFPIFTQSF